MHTNKSYWSKKERQTRKMWVTLSSSFRDFESCISRSRDVIVCCPIVTASSVISERKLSHHNLASQLNVLILWLELLGSAQYYFQIHGIASTVTTASARWPWVCHVLGMLACYCCSCDTLPVAVQCLKSSENAMPCLFFLPYSNYFPNLIAHCIFNR